MLKIQRGSAASKGTQLLSLAARLDLYYFGNQLCLLPGDAMYLICHIDREAFDQSVSDIKGRRGLGGVT